MQRGRQHNGDPLQGCEAQSPRVALSMGSSAPIMALAMHSADVARGHTQLSSGKTPCQRSGLPIVCRPQRSSGGLTFAALVAAGNRELVSPLAGVVGPARLLHTRAVHDDCAIYCKQGAAGGLVCARRTQAAWGSGSSSNSNGKQQQRRLGWQRQRQRQRRRQRRRQSLRVQ